MLVDVDLRIGRRGLTGSPNDHCRWEMQIDEDHHEGSHDGLDVEMRCDHVHSEEPRLRVENESASCSTPAQNLRRTGEGGLGVHTFITSSILVLVVHRSHPG